MVRVRVSARVTVREGMTKHITGLSGLTGAIVNITGC